MLFIALFVLFTSIAHTQTVFPGSNSWQYNNEYDDKTEYTNINLTQVSLSLSYAPPQSYHDVSYHVDIAALPDISSGKMPGGALRRHSKQ